ncbi:MAG: twin-arginine translocase subunit TatC [Halobacteriaceae archaeon]
MSGAPGDEADDSTGSDGSGGDGDADPPVEEGHESDGEPDPNEGNAGADEAADPDPDDGADAAEGDGASTGDDADAGAPGDSDGADAETPDPDALADDEATVDPDETGPELTEADDGTESADAPDSADFDRPEAIEAASGSGESLSGETVTGDDAAAYGPEGGPLQTEGPAQDQEMPLAAHIEEMVKRLIVVVAVAGLTTALTFPFGEEIINFLWRSVLPPGQETRPHLYNPLELVITQLKVASLAGVVVALPVLVYESYRFMRPGLYPHERRYYLAAVPTSLLLAFVGITFAYFIVLPAVFGYFFNYTQGVSQVAFSLGSTFDLILILMGYLAIVFQIPLFTMLAMMMGLVTRSWLASRRLLFWGAFLGISFLFSPDPTGMAPLVITVTMIVLFEGTLLLTKWTGRG